MELKAFTGMANTSSSETLPEGGLVHATNVDIDDTGHIRRRRGTTQIDAASYHSLFKANDDTVFGVKDGNLCRLNDALTATSIYAGVGSEQLHYVQVGERIYAKSSSQALSFTTDGTVEQWGVPHVPVFYAASSNGVMPAAEYQIVLTYTRLSDGLEGGASEGQNFTLHAQGGIYLSGIPSIAGYAANVYISTPNGETLYRVAKGVQSTTTISALASQLGIPLRTTGKYPPSGRGPLAQSFGRIYIVDGHALWATDPFQYEQVDMAVSYKLMESRITFAASVTAGIYVGTESGVFFMGGEFDKATLVRVSMHGAPDQTPQKIDASYVLKGDQQGVGVLFMTDGGICVGMQNGEVINLTNKQFEFPKATEVSLMYRKQDGLNQFLGVSSHPGTPTGSARFGDFVDAEIIRHKEL